MARFKRALAFGSVLASSLVVSVLIWIDHADDERIRSGNMVLSALVVAGVIALQIIESHDHAELSRALGATRRDRERLTTTDDLTGLYNRRVFLERLAQEAERSLMTSQPLALIIMDLDNFRQFNVEHGHSVGDMMLTEIAQHIRGAARSKDVIARFGCDEFIYLVAGIGEDGAVAIAERLREAIRDAKIIVTSGARLSVTASVGVAAATGRSEVGADALMARANRAMRRAREFGMDRVVCARLPTPQYGLPHRGGETPRP